MPDKNAALRDHLVRALAWEDAHVGFDTAVTGIPHDKRGLQAAGFEHTLWQLVEHLRIAQEDILDFCVNPSYEHSMTWPDDYWPKAMAPPSEEAWARSIDDFKRSREAMARLARDVADLSAVVPTGQDGQTYLRAVLLIIDHAAYHVGQVVAVRRALGIWPAAPAPQA
jgi:uncharacterized damage-inducible protein DinB